MQSTVGCYVVTPPFFNFEGPPRVCNELIALENLLLCMVLSLNDCTLGASALLRGSGHVELCNTFRSGVRRRRASTGRQKLPGAPRRPPTDVAPFGVCAPRRLRPAPEAPRAKRAKQRVARGGAVKKIVCVWRNGSILCVWMSYRRAKAVHYARLTAVLYDWRKDAAKLS